jgi:hypothetical protein
MKALTHSRVILKAELKDIPPTGKNSLSHPYMFLMIPEMS